MEPDEPVTVLRADVLPPELFNLRRVARVLTLYHLLMIPLLIFLGNPIISALDWIGDKLFSLPAIQTGANDFWMVPVIGLAATLAFCCARVWMDVRRRDWMQPVLITHGVMAVSFLAYYFLDVRSLAYLGALGLEGLLFLGCAYFWWAAGAARG